MNGLIITAVLWVLSLAGVGYQAYSMGQDNVKAKNADESALRQNVIDDARRGAAEAIAGIQIVHTTIQGELRREIRTNTIYADCKHTPDGLRLLNDALENRKSVGPGSGSKLPAASSPSR